MALLKPFYQGKLDVFCAMYAVLNGIRLTHGIRTLKARDILNDTLFALSSEPAAFRAVLDQKTDYVFLVDRMLSFIAKKYPLEVVKPFGAENLPDVETFWQVCADWLNPNGVKAEARAILCRFCRYQPIGDEAVVKHWTTIDRINDDVLHLFDSSHEAESIQSIRRENMATFRKDVGKTRFLHMQSDTLRFLRLPF